MQFVCKSPVWHLVKGFGEIHDDPMIPVQSSIQVTNHVMKEVNQLARPLTTEALLTVSKNIFKGSMLINIDDYYMLKGFATDAS